MTDGLNLPAAGLTADERGRITVDEFYRTKVENIYAVGDVIGFPALAATSMEQGRLAAHHAFGEPVTVTDAPQPIGIYSIPEISFVGRTEDQLTDACVPFEVGVSRYRELARGAIVGDSYGVLKLLVSPADRKLLGVHVFGTGATELIHIGQAVMGCGGTVDYLVERGLQLPDPVRGVQGRRARRHQQDARRHPPVGLTDQSIEPKPVLSNGPWLRLTAHVCALVRIGQRTSRDSQPSAMPGISHVAHWLAQSKRAPGSVKLRTGGDSPRTGRTSGWPIRWNSGTDG